MSWARSVRKVRRANGFRPRAVIGAVGVLLAGGLGILAVRDQGYAAQAVDLSQATVWVTNNSDLLVGRINKQVDQLNSSVRVNGPFDVYQDGDTVLVLDGSKHELRPLDVVSVTLGGKISLPQDADVAMGGGVLGIADEKTGAVWAGTPTQLSALDPGGTPATVKTAADVQVAVSQSGTVFAAAPGSADLWTARAPSAAPGGSSSAAGQGGSATPPGAAPQTLAGGPLSPRQSGAASPISITTVGDVPVVLDRAAGTLRFRDHSVPIPDAATAVLQQAGPAADSVVVATSAALLRIPLSGGGPQTIVSGRSGAPAAPAVLDGCTNAAWSSTPAQYAVTCGGAAPTLRQIPGHTGTAAMVFRVNRHTIVLNDVTTGNTWTVDAAMKLINNWDEVKPLSDADNTSAANSGTEGSSEQLTDSRTNCKTGKVQPPVPQGDKYGVRAGRSTVLHVLDNDASSDCSMLVITGVDGWTSPSDGGVQVVDNGQAIQVTVPQGATGTLPDITYHISDGLGHTGKARVMLKVVPAGTHEPPVKLHDSEVPVESLGTVSYNVLSDYVSPVGDDLYLVSASIGTGDEVSFQPNGTITYSDKGVGGAVKKTVKFVVSDGTDQVPGQLSVDVKQDGTLSPLTSPVYASAAVGRPVTVDILRSVITTTVEPTTLSTLTPIGKVGATVGAIDQTGGTATLTGTKPGTYYFTYQVAAGAKTATGLLRLDVFQPATQPTAPVAMTDVVYLPTGGVVTVDPTANDTDPMATGLAVIQVRPDPRLSVTTENMQTVTISAQSTLPADGAAIAYTVSNGFLTANGVIRVVPVPAEQPVPPVAHDITAIVREGDAVTIPIAAHAFDPNGNVIALTGLRTDTVPSGSGVLFYTPTAIRYLAPDKAPATPLQFSYTVTNNVGVSASGSVTISVLAESRTVNHPPRTPAPVLARVFTGGTVSIPLPLDGIDPDGDWVTLAGLGAQAPHLGGATASGLQTISYQAGRVPGYDTFDYIATDPYGATSTGQVSVLVVAPPASLQPPVAPDLNVSARPGRTVDIDVLGPASAANGSIRLALANPAFAAPPDWKVTVTPDGGHLEVVTPAADTIGSITYTVKNDQGLKGSGVLTVTVSQNAPLKPPTATDVVVTAAQLKKGQTSVDVPIPDDKISDPNGNPGDLTVSLDPQAKGSATMTGQRTVHVPLTASRQVLAYQVTSPDHLTATAFIVVPPQNSGTPPTAAPNQPKQAPTAPLSVSPTQAPLSVKAGQTLKINVNQYVTAADGSRLLVPNGGPVTVSGGGQAGRVSNSEIDYTAAKDGNGTVYVSFMVTDGKREPVGVTLPITVIPTVVPAPVVSSVALSVQAGKNLTQDVSGLVTAGNAAQRALLTYQVRGGGSGISATLSGSMLTVTATPGAKGQSARFTLTARDGQGKTGTGTITVTATGSLAPLAKVRNLTVDNGRPGQASTVNVLSAVTYDPFPSPMTVVSLQAQSGAGSVSLNGSTAVITPSAVGSVVAAFTLADATNDPSRYVSGTITVTVKDKPSRPGTPTVVSIASQTVQLAWTAPNDNGSPITSYVVTATSAKQSCPASPCTIRNLVNGQPYSFTVQAVNAVAPSVLSVASAPVTPDTAPNTPAPPVLTWVGSGALQVQWTNPGSSGTPVSSYDLRMIGQADTTGRSQLSGLTGTSTTWKNLQNGTAYTFQVEAHNSSKRPSGWSPASAPETPSGRAGAPTNLSVTFGQDNYNPGGNTLSVSWNPPTDNGGAAVTGYVVKYTSSAGGGTIPVQAPGTSTQIQGVRDGVAYTVTVAAVNRSGNGAASAPATATPYSPPGGVTGLTASATGQNGQVALNWSPAQGHGRNIDHYQITWNGGSDTATGNSDTLSGLSNVTNYTFSVKACYANSVSFNICGSAASASANPYGPVGAPAVGTCGNNQSQVCFNWSAPADNGRGPYQFKYNVDGGGWSGLTGATSVSVGNGCAQGHSIQVVAVDTQGHQSTSPGGTSGSTAACPPPPMQIWLTQSGNTLTYHWSNLQPGMFSSRNALDCWRYTESTHPGGWATDNCGRFAFSFNGQPTNGSVTITPNAPAVDGYSVDLYAGGPWINVGQTWTNGQ